MAIVLVHLSPVFPCVFVCFCGAGRLLDTIIIFDGVLRKHMGHSRRRRFVTCVGMWFGDMVYFLMTVAELHVVPGHALYLIVVLAIALNRIESNPRHRVRQNVNFHRNELRNLGGAPVEPSIS